MNTASQRKLSKDGSVHVTDEQFNTRSHLAALVFALLGSVLLVVDASAAADSWKIVSFSIYGASLILLFCFSTLHHGLDGSPRTEHVLRLLDYCAIFMLIGGTVTPVCLVVLRNPSGWAVFGVTWAVALAGILVKVVRPDTPKSITLTLYIALGWVPVVLAQDLMQALPLAASVLVVLGGVIYTVGGFIFILERPNPFPGRFGFHEIWHLFVIAGAAAHFAFMYLYVRTY